MGAIKPLQRLTYSKKVAGNDVWGKENIDYHLDSSDVINNNKISEFFY